MFSIGSLSSFTIYGGSLLFFSLGISHLTIWTREDGRPAPASRVDSYALSGYAHCRDARCTHLAKRICGSGVNSSCHCYDRSHRHERARLSDGLCGYCAQCWNSYRPLLGGVIYARAAYYAVCAMVLAFLVFDIVFRLVLIEARAAKKQDPCIAPLDGEVEVRTMEGSNAKANTTSIIASDATVPQPQNQKRCRMSNLLPPTVTLFANPRVVIALWGYFW
jgi:hypothetical protein